MATPLAIVFGAPAWIVPALVLGAIFLLVLVWSYRGGLASRRVRTLAFALKLVGVALLLVCLPEPQLPRQRARAGENQLFLLVDASRSLTLRDRDGSTTRGERLLEVLERDAPWLVRAGQDFVLERYTFGERLRGRDDFDRLVFDESSTRLRAALKRVIERHRNRPLAGVVLFSDGNATDVLDETFPWNELPPVYVVPAGSRQTVRDLGFEQVAVSRTEFESAPITVSASVRCRDTAQEPIEVLLKDESGRILERQEVRCDRPDDTINVRFQVGSPTSGVTFHALDVHFAGTSDDAPDNVEATLENNTHWIASERRAGPFRVLYVSGRPNWEYKFLRRALAPDEDMELVALLRIAKRQARFTFRPSGQDRRNQLYEGFDNKDEEEAEEYDEPVMVRLGTKDELELRGGFPRTKEDLYAYHAIVCDDLEGSFFSHDQKVLVQRFVAERGGGLLVLGGAESFASGSWNEGPFQDVLPVYLDRIAETASAGRQRLGLTREGLLEPWVRLRTTEDEESMRLAAMPGFATVNSVGRPKPGASILWHVRDERGRSSPALITHRFGKGRSAAVTIGDLWRWHLRREDPAKSDFEIAWRQMLRWLVTDVPRRIEFAAEEHADGRTIDLRVVLRDARYDPEGQARVRIEVKTPDGGMVTLDARPSSEEAGVFVASFVARDTGVHRAKAIVHRLADDTEETRETGWVSQPAAREFERLDVDVNGLTHLATRTGGRVVPLDELEHFAEELAYEDVPRTELELTPLWHGAFLFALAVVCLCAEWGLRRSRGLP